MKSMQTIVLLLAVSAPVAGQIGPKPPSCKTSFGFVYTDKLGNKYESVQGKELKEIQERLSKKQHGTACIIDEGAPDYIFSVRGNAKTRLVDGTEYPYTEYKLEVHRGASPFELMHTFSRSSLPGRHRAENSAPIIDLIEEAAAYLGRYPEG